MHIKFNKIANVTILRRMGAKTIPLLNSISIVLFFCNDQYYYIDNRTIFHGNINGCVNELNSAANINWRISFSHPSSCPSSSIVTFKQNLLLGTCLLKHPQYYLSSQYIVHFLSLSLSRHWHLNGHHYMLLDFQLISDHVNLNNSSHFTNQCGVR